MIAYPNAKINLGLNILRKREDGFHAIESVFVPVPWHDILEINIDSSAPAGTVAFSSSGIEVPNDGKPNLCQRAYQLLNDHAPLPGIRMHLHKMIPIGAGLGGGSADGAFALNMLNSLMDLNHSTQHLEQLAAQLGSDCPFFVRNSPQFVTGRGEMMEDIVLKLEGLHVLVVYPNIHISTAEAYSGVVPATPAQSLGQVISMPIYQWKNHLHNDFEDSLFGKHVALPALKQLLYDRGAIYASMTGSGSTIYGIFHEKMDIPLPQDHLHKWMSW